MCFPGCLNIPNISCIYTRTTETTANQTENDQDDGSIASAPVVTSQPWPTTTTEMKLLLSPNNEDGLLETVERVQQLVEDSQRIIKNPHIQQGCLVCYDQCAPRCSYRCGCFGSWLCACFKACCIVETPITTNIPKVMQQMDKKYGPLSLALALQELRWEITKMAINNRHITEEEQEDLEKACKKAKKKLTGSFVHLSQQYFYDLTKDLPGSPLVKSVLPLLFKIMKEKSWTQPIYQHTPLKCWILEPTTEDELPLSRLSLDRSSLSPATDKNMYPDPTRAIGIKYDKKKMTRFLSDLEVYSLESGTTGKLGVKEAHLVTTVFDILCLMSAGEDSPLTLSDGCLGYGMEKFVKLFMLILTTCGYVPLDDNKTTDIKYDDPNDEYAQIYKQAMLNYNNPKDAAAPLSRPLEMRRQSLGDELLGARPKTKKTVGFSQTVLIESSTSIIPSPLSSSTPSSPLSRRPLVRQDSVRTYSTPSDDYQPQVDQEWLQLQLDGISESSDDEEGIERQRQLVNSSLRLEKLFAAMRQEYGE